jgi:hypothetical protein
MSHDQAMFSDAFPCNPRPFRTALRDYLADGGNLQSDHAKRILFTLTAIIRGQLAHIDLATNATYLHAGCSRMPGRDNPIGVLDAMEAEAEGLDTRLTLQQWWTSISSLIYWAYGAEGELSLCEEWSRLKEAFDAAHYAWTGQAA